MHAARWCLWWGRLALVAVLAGTAGGCGRGAQAPEERAAHQEELRARYPLGPRTPLPLSQLAALAHRDSSSAEAQSDLAGALVLAGQYAEAMEVYQRGARAHPDDVRTRQGLASLYARIGRLEEAIAEWTRVVALRPDYAEAHFRLGVAFAQKAPTAVDQPANLDYAALDTAIAHCSRAAELDPGNALYHHNVGRALQLRHESARAAQAYRRALALDSALVEAHRFLGEIALERGELAAAQGAYRAVVALDSADAQGHYHLGKALERAGAVEEAVRAYERAASLQPQHRAAHYGLAQLYPRVGRPEAAQRALALFHGLEEEDELQAARRRVQRLPSGIAERRALAVAHAKEGEYAAAAEQLRIALALATGPTRAPIHHDLGLVYDRLGQQAGALEALRAAAALSPDSARFQLHLGQAYAKAGLDSPAVAALGRALNAQPGWTQAQYELAMLHVRGRRPDLAQPLFLSVLRSEPGHVGARFGLSLTYIDQQRHGEAARQLEEVLRRQPDYPRARQLLQVVRKRMGASAGAG
ncbi:MAG: tetratricopeptide repeat protein [Candidatus Latescibacterota bacterium]